MWLLKVSGAKLCTVPVLCSQVSVITLVWRRLAENKYIIPQVMVTAIAPFHSYWRSPTSEYATSIVRLFNTDFNDWVMSTSLWHQSLNRYAFVHSGQFFQQKYGNFWSIVLQSCGEIVSEWENWRLIYLNSKDLKLITANL